MNKVIITETELKQLVENSIRKKINENNYNEGWFRNLFNRRKNNTDASAQDNPYGPKPLFPDGNETDSSNPEPSPTPEPSPYPSEPQNINQDSNNFESDTPLDTSFFTFSDEKAQDGGSQPQNISQDSNNFDTPEDTVKAQDGGSQPQNISQDSNNFDTPEDTVKAQDGGSQPQNIDQEPSSPLTQQPESKSRCPNCGATTNGSDRCQYCGSSIGGKNNIDSSSPKEQAKSLLKNSSSFMAQANQAMASAKQMCKQYGFTLGQVMYELGMKNKLANQYAQEVASRGYDDMTSDEWADSGMFSGPTDKDMRNKEAARKREADMRAAQQTASDKWDNNELGGGYLEERRINRIIRECVRRVLMEQGQTPIEQTKELVRNWNDCLKKAGEARTQANQICKKYGLSIGQLMYELGINNKQAQQYKQQIATRGYDDMTSDELADSGMFSGPTDTDRKNQEMARQNAEKARIEQEKAQNAWGSGDVYGTDMFGNKIWEQKINKAIKKSIIKVLMEQKNKKRKRY